MILILDYPGRSISPDASSSRSSNIPVDIACSLFLIELQFHLCRFEMNEFDFSK